MKLPQTPDTDATGDLAVTFCQLAFEKRKWKFRRQEGRSDFGIDAEVEIVEKNLVTGQLLKAQVKGQAETHWETNGYVLIPVDVSTYNLWKSLPLPIIALLCDVTTESVYWSLPLTRMPRRKADTVSLRFEKNQSLINSFDLLETFLRSWFRVFSQENILLEVPHFYRYFQEIAEIAGWGDPWSMIGEDLDEKSRLFYNHLIELRLRLGLSCTDLPTIDEWNIRSAATWGDDEFLFWGTFEELYLYVKPFYEEAVDILRKRITQAERRIENQELHRFFARLDGGTPIRFLDPRVESKTFAEQFDDRLRRRGILKYRQTDRFSRPPV
jgi:hypothetical protein